MHSRHTERSEVSRVSCVALAANSRLGFTLPEVCVALAIFLVGITALLGGWKMESLVANRLDCADSLSVRLTRVPGSPHLAWAVVASEHYSLKRLVRCR